MEDKKSKIVVITGASAGVGRATAHEFAKTGATVVLLAREPQSLEETKKEVDKMGGKGIYYPLDVADYEKVETTFQTIEQEVGPVDILVNNAMTSVFSQIKDMTPKEFQRVTEVTYLGQVYCAMSVLKHMFKRDQGKIVFVGSALAYRGIPLQAAYCGAKHGTQGFFDSLRAELLHDKSNVKITMVELPALNTTQFRWVKSKLPNKARPMGTIFQPEVAARAIKYAAEHDRREIFVALPTFQAIIGNKFFPGLLDKMMAKTGVSGQQTDEKEDPNRKNNLWEPVPGMHSTHGVFGEKAKDSSPALWLSMHPGVFWGIIILLVVVIIALII